MFEQNHPFLGIRALCELKASKLIPSAAGERQGWDRSSTDERHPTIFMACAADIAWAAAAGLAATSLTATIFLARSVLNWKGGSRCLVQELLRDAGGSLLREGKKWE